MRRVIAIAGPVGGGKSALTAALSAALGDAPVLRFDDYQTATRQAMAELEDWLARGADFDRLEAPGLAARLAQLRAVDGDGGQGWLVFEMPLGRAWSPAAAAIDRLVWLDVPADIALARKLRELTSAARGATGDDAREALRWIEAYLGHYLDTLHRVLAAQRAAVAPAADLVLDGRAPADELVRQVLAHLQGAA